MDTAAVLMWVLVVFVVVMFVAAGVCVYEIARIWRDSRREE